MLELKASKSLQRRRPSPHPHPARADGGDRQVACTGIARELRPASIDELGLNSALANYVSDWSQQFGIPADFHHGRYRPRHLTDEKRTAIYRSCRRRCQHRQARPDVTSVSVVVGRSGGTVQLTIEDKGRWLRHRHSDWQRQRVGQGPAWPRRRRHARTAGADRRRTRN